MSMVRAVKMILTLHCNESSRLLSDGMERHLTVCERVALRMHLLVCRSCRRFGRNIRLLHDLMHRLHQRPTDADHSSLSPQRRDRIRAAVRKAEEDSR